MEQQNVQENGEFVLNIVTEDLATAMNRTSGEWEYEVDEWQMAGLAQLPSIDVRPSRIAGAPVALESRLLQTVPVPGTAYTMILGRIVRFHIRKDLLRDNGLVDAALLRPVARLGGDEYTTLGQIFTMVRPQV
ncbi:MAG: flavin reductase family protein [Chloroflexi bacterium]|nr:flavin reductase family protein [Chloroflexota bacterium]